MIKKVNPEEVAQQVKKDESTVAEGTQETVKDFEKVTEAAVETAKSQPVDSAQVIGQVPVPGTGAGKGSGTGSTVKK